MSDPCSRLVPPARVFQTCWYIPIVDNQLTSYVITWTLDMNHTTSNISTISIGLTTVSTVCLYLIYLRLFCSYRTTFHTGTPPCRLVQILKQAKLGQFSTYSIETGPYAHENYTYNMIRPFDCTGLSSDSLKKERLCLKIVLGQAWFDLYCTVIFFCWTQPFWVRIGSACKL